MSNMQAFARSELARLGMKHDGPEDDINTMMAHDVLSIVERFGEQGHSGMSAAYAVGLLEKLLRYEPLSPLTGEADEWLECGSGMFQNVRCSHVFKDEDGAYDIEGKVFVEPSGISFTSCDSRVPVTFPYTPKREYVNVPASPASDQE